VLPSVRCALTETEMVSDKHSLIAAIHRAMPNIKAGSLVVFGDVFGGRIDNIHRVVSATANEDGSTTIHFDQGEMLTVWEPSGLDVSSVRFRIVRANRVRWEWFYYGRPQTDENRYAIEYQVEGDRVTVSDNADWANVVHGASLHQPAVELL